MLWQEIHAENERPGSNLLTADQAAQILNERGYSFTANDLTKISGYGQGKTAPMYVENGDRRYYLRTQIENWVPDDLLPRMGAKRGRPTRAMIHAWGGRCP